MTAEPQSPPPEPDLLDELMSIGMELTRDMRDQALAREMPAKDAATAYDKLSRSLRLSIALKQRLGGKRIDLPKSRIYSEGREAARLLYSKVKKQKPRGPAPERDRPDRDPTESDGFEKEFQEGRYPELAFRGQPIRVVGLEICKGLGIEPEDRFDGPDWDQILPTKATWIVECLKAGRIVRPPPG